MCFTSDECLALDSTNRAWAVVQRESTSEQNRVLLGDDNRVAILTRVVSRILFVYDDLLHARAVSKRSVLDE